MTVQVQSALEDMMKADCPGEIQTTEGTDVKYFRDFEDDNSEVSESKTSVLCNCNSERENKHIFHFKNSHLFELTHQNSL